MLDISDRHSCFYWQTDRNLSAEAYVNTFLKRQALSEETLVEILRGGVKSQPDVSKIKISAPDENVLKGNVNIVRKIQIADQSYIVRLHPQGVKNGYFYVEKLALELAQNHGLPVPTALEIHQATDAPDADFMLMTVSAGVTMADAIKNLAVDEASLLRECGKRMAQIHGIAVNGYGSFDNAKAMHGELVGMHQSYRDFIHAGLDENLSRLVHFDILSLDEKKDIETIFSEKNFEPPNGSRLIHNDFADWNLLTDGKKVTGILDWDECHAGDPVADLACWSVFFTAQRYVPFLEGYALVAALPQDYEERFHFYRLRYVVSKMALRAKRRQVDNSPFLEDMIRNGLAALTEEKNWFKRDAGLDHPQVDQK